MTGRKDRSEERKMNSAEGKVVSQVNSVGTEEGIRIRKKGLSSSTLKIIAIAAMLIDHIGAVVLTRLMMQRGLGNFAQMDVDTQIAWLTANAGIYFFTMLIRLTIGRIAFPIFCFLLTEGFTRTSDIKRYAIRLGLFALISEIPFDLATSGVVLEFRHQNVFFTLFLGMLVMIGISTVEKQTWNKAVRVILSGAVVIAGMAAAILLRTDYDALGVLLIVALYVFRKKKSWQILAGCAVICFASPLLKGFAMLFSEILAVLAFIFIGLYNGERGLRLKYVFYLFYPVHLLILQLICVLMGMGSIPTM